MAKMARADKEVSTLLIKEKFEQAKKVSGLESPAREEDGNVDWVLNLTKDGNGKIEKTIANVTLVLENDPLLKGKIVIDQFASCGMVLGALPWDQREEKRRWKDVDYAGYYRYMETFYGLTGKEKLDNGLLIVSSQNQINEVEDYLESLKWDGKKRVDTLLSDIWVQRTMPIQGR